MKRSQRRRLQRTGRTILRILLLMGVVLLGIIGYVMLKSAPKICRTTEDVEGAPYDAIVVLGCGVNKDGSLSAMLTYRLEKALEAYEEGLAPMILVTGDHRVGEYDEPDHMAEYLIKKGVPNSAIVRDYTGYSTYESMYNTAIYAASGSVDGMAGDLKRIVVITQQYHLFRAMYIAQHFGLEVCGLPAQDWHLTAGTAFRHLRELPGCLKDFVQCLTDGGISR